MFRNMNCFDAGGATVSTSPLSREKRAASLPHMRKRSARAMFARARIMIRTLSLCACECHGLEVVDSKVCGCRVHGFFFGGGAPS